MQLELKKMKMGSATTSEGPATTTKGSSTMSLVGTEAKLVKVCSFLNLTSINSLKIQQKYMKCAPAHHTKPQTTQFYLSSLEHIKSSHSFDLKQLIRTHTELILNKKMNE